MREFWKDISLGVGLVLAGAAACGMGIVIDQTCRGDHPETTINIENLEVYMVQEEES